MNPQPVVVKDFRGIAREKIACGILDGKVLITSERGLKSIENGSEIYPIPFPPELVFCFSPNVDGSTPDWASLEPWGIGKGEFAQ